MNPVRVVINQAGRARAYEFEQQDDTGHWLPITVGRVAVLAKMQSRTIHAHARTLHGGQVHDITRQLLEWQALYKRRWRAARKERLAIEPVSFSERSRRSWVSRKARAEKRRHYVNAEIAAGRGNPYTRETES